VENLLYHWRHLSKNEAELEVRIVHQINNFIDAERRRYGKFSVFKHEAQTLELFEKLKLIEGSFSHLR